MSVLSKFVSKLGAIAPILFSVPLVMAQSVPSPVGAPPNSIPTQTAIPDPAAGYYSGRFGNGDPVFLTVLETGEFLFSTRPAPAYLLVVVRGVGQGTNGRFTSNDAVLLGGANSPTPYFLSAVYSTGIGMDVSLYQSANSAPTNFSITYDKRYEIPYPISSIAGRYNGLLQAGNTTSSMVMDVSADGSLSASLSSCTLAGRAAQLSPTTNPYQVSISFTGAHCDFGKNTATGIMSVSESATQPGTFVITMIGTNLARDTLLYIYLSKNPVPIAAPPQPTSPSDSPSPPPPAPAGMPIEGGSLTQ